jgi:P4 family phage/plasmid primase-like protien
LSAGATLERKEKSLTQGSTSWLSAHHREELQISSTIDPDVIVERGYRTIERPDRNGGGIMHIPGVTAVEGTSRDLLKAMGFPGWAIREDHYYPGLWIPQYTPRGVRYAGQFKPFRAVRDNAGKLLRYASAKGQNRLDVHPRWSADRGRDDAALPPAIQDASLPLWITEGVKKADALTSRGCVTVALAGVYNWRNTHGTLGDWEDVAIRGREVWICFDADAITKSAVARAMERLGKWLRHKGAAKVRYAVTPGLAGDRAVKGVDDYLAAGGTLAELRAASRDAAPLMPAERDPFTDAAMADTIAADVLDGTFIRATGLGWLHWNGRRWVEVDEGMVTEAVRGYILSRYAEALDTERHRANAGQEPRPGEIEGWRKLQGASRIHAVVKLAGNVTGVLRRADELDADPDLLNTPEGVLDLCTLAVTPHDPDLLMTKCTRVPYLPGATHEAFSAALEAVPGDALEWLCVRLGQAATGHMTDDERAVLLTGSGRNGKTTLMDTIFRSLGGYAALIPSTLLVGGGRTGGATPERMTVRGVRLAYIEETPEGGHLDTQALKTVVGTPSITGRQLFEKFVTFGATHSLFLNTNHVPVVTETGEGEWRRLVRLAFPYRFRRADQALERDTDRRGDPTLKTRLAEPAAQEAALAFLVDGAHRWYEAGRSLEYFADPPTVLADTRQWRHDFDVILRFLDERMVFDRDAWVAGDELYAEATDWLAGVGQARMAQNTFLTRLKTHSALPPYVVQGQAMATRAGVSRRPIRGWLGDQRKDLPARVRAVFGLRFSTG